MGAQCCCPDMYNRDVAELEELLSDTDVSIRIITWNVANGFPSDTTSLSKLLQQRADLMVIGLQEIVDVNSAQHMIVDDDTGIKWDNLIHSVLNADSNNKKKSKRHKKRRVTYSKLGMARLMGVCLLIYAKDNIRKHIKDLMTGKIGTGLLGAGPNKGGVAIRFELYQTKVAFVCAHLAAHKPNVADRNDNYHKIMSKLSFAERYSDDIKQSEMDLGYVSVDSHDLVFFFGDLNYRLEFDDRASVLRLIEQQEWSALLAKDQLLMQQQEKKAFDGFQEKEIEFQPTYKFVVGKNEYDALKGRMPSWCDRVLWKNNMTENIARRSATGSKKVECTEYDIVMDECLSDHKPVVALFHLQHQMYL